MERAKDANIVGILVGTLGVGMLSCQFFCVPIIITKVTCAYTELYCHMPCEAL